MGVGLICHGGTLHGGRLTGHDNWKVGTILSMTLDFFNHATSHANQKKHTMAMKK